MQEEIFRKKSLDRMKSPEALDDYIRVSNPGVWLVLISIIVLLLGTCVWGIFGRIDSTVPSTVCIRNGEAVCYLAEESISSVQTGMLVRYAEREAVIDEIGEKGELGFVCVLQTESAPADGFYEGKIIVKSYRPISFILN